MADTGKPKRTFRLTPPILDALDAAAAKDGVSPSEYVRSVLKRWFRLDEPPKVT